MHTPPTSLPGEPSVAAQPPIAAATTSSFLPVRPDHEKQQHALSLADDNHVSPTSTSPPRILIIGAGSRGTAYASAITAHTAAIVVAVAEPIPFKRREFVRRFIVTPPQEEGDDADAPPRAFADWRDFAAWEQARREHGRQPSIDAAFVCVLDEQHRAVVVEGLAPLRGVAVMCEKPLATTLADCVAIYEAMGRGGNGHGGETLAPGRIFGIGHVLRYSPHNMLLRRLVRELGVVGEVLSVEHTEPVGWWHFSHSYVRYG